MVAHGTIAFDTLTTSDQKKTGTEKSLDTSYLYNGSSKVWAYFKQASSTGGAEDSLNVSSITDDGAGDFDVNYTSLMANDDYATAQHSDAVGNNLMTNRTPVEGSSYSTSLLRFLHYENASLVDATAASVQIVGELA